jgi:sec-independent protein translocase protein TatA
VWRNIQGWQLFIIIIAVIVLVGWKRLPDAARSVGRSMRIFKSEVEQMTDKGDDDKPSAASSDVVDGEPRGTARPAPSGSATDPSTPPPTPADPVRDPVDGDSGERRP